MQSGQSKCQTDATANDFIRPTKLFAIRAYSFIYSSIQRGCCPKVSATFANVIIAHTL